MTSALSAKGVWGFGIEPLLELPWDDPEDQWDLVEHVRMHGAVPTDTEGSVLGTDSAHNNRRDWYNSSCSGHAHKLTYEEWVTKDHRTPKQKARDELIEHWRERKRIKDEEREGREQSEYALAQSNMGLRSWAARTSEDHQDQALRRQAAEQQERLERKRREDEEHECRRRWAIETSEVERIIVEATESINCGVMDRAMMRAMMRYMNFGPGKGKAWDTRAFVLYIAQTRRDDLLTQTINDVERCYDTLMQTVVNAW